MKPFTLSILTLVLLLLGTFLAAADAIMVKPSDQDKAVAELQALRGKLKFEGKAVIGADLGDIDITDAWLVYLDALPQLKSLSLLHGSKVTAAGLVHVYGLKELEVLDLHDVAKPMTDAELAKLVKALPHLKSLGLCDCAHLSDAGLACLAGMTRLQALDLSWCNPITDAGLEHLRGLSGLKTLTLPAPSAWTKITDAGVQKLQASLPNCKIRR